MLLNISVLTPLFSTLSRNERFLFYMSSILHTKFLFYMSSILKFLKRGLYSKAYNLYKFNCKSLHYYTISRVCFDSLEMKINQTYTIFIYISHIFFIENENYFIFRSFTSVSNHK